MSEQTEQSSRWGTGATIIFIALGVMLAFFIVYAIYQAYQDSIPPEITFEEKDVPDRGACVPGGCSGELCIFEGLEITSTCVIKPEYECLQLTTCELLDEGGCGWVETEEYLSCVADLSEVEQVE